MQSPEDANEAVIVNTAGGVGLIHPRSAGKFKTICHDRAAAIDHTARRARKIVQVLNCRSGEIDSRAIVGQSKVCEVVREELGFRPI